MKNLLHPKWLFLINTLPITIYLILSGFEFHVVRTLLDEDALITWGIYAGILALVAGGVLWYAFQRTYKNEEVSAKFAVTSLAIFVPYVITHLFYFEEVLWGIPNWMIAPDFEIYAVTFLMPTIIYALFVLVQKISIENFDEGWKNLLAAAAIPFLIYVFIQVVLPFWNLGGGDAEAIFSMLIFSIVALLFLFFVIRGAYFMISKRGEMRQGWKLFWRICIAVVCPILGLMLNQGMIGDFYIGDDEGIFGNFGNPWFYGIAVLNGILVCLPELENPKYRLAIFGGRAIGFSYVTYFFLVFLPFLPLSVVGVIAFGLGFLMLTPLILFIMQSRFLSNDFDYLKGYFSKDILRVLLVVGFLVLPTIVTLNYLNDKKVLNETLDYLYYPDYSKDYDLNKKSINRILTNIKTHDRNGGGFIMENPHHTPFLSRFYTHLVLDNMTLSNNKIRKIESVINGSGVPARMAIDRNRNDTMIHITDIEVESTYDAEQNAWRTWVNFEMTNTDTTNGQREYDTTFDLPAGCYISDYYLDIEDRREHGILAEKRAAIWVYQQITRVTRRDPGLLNYVGADKVRFRVFPFVKEEVRTTGIEFLHKEPITINVDDFEIQLGNQSQQKPITTATDLTDNLTYVSAFAKSRLEKVERQPYYHFIVDASRKYNINGNTERLEQFIKKNNIDLAKAEFNFTNSYSTISTQKDFKENGQNDWQTAYKNHSFNGGFFVERAIEKALLNAYNYRKNEFPIIVVVSESSYHLMIMTKEFSDWKMMYPELSEFYFLSDEDKLVRHPLVGNPIQPIDTVQVNHPLITLTPIDTITVLDSPQTLLAYPNAKTPVAYLPDNGKASIVMTSTEIDLDFKAMKKNDWQSALTMHGSWLSQNIHPETAENAYYELVKASFKSNVLTPTTSFLALENEAQKAMLRKKQQEALLGNKALDIAGQPNSMSEPELWLVLFLFGAFVWWRRRKVLV